MASIPEKPPPSTGAPFTFELRATTAAGESLEPPLPARGEPASNAVLRAPLAQTLAAIGVDTEIEVRSAALRHRQAVAQPVVAPATNPSRWS